MVIALICIWICSGIFGSTIAKVDNSIDKIDQSIIDQYSDQFCGNRSFFVGCQSRRQRSKRQITSLLKFYPPNATETQFKRFLFANVSYNRNVRPSRQPALNSIKVQVRLTITLIEALNEKQQTMAIHGFMGLGWYDDFLIWNSSANRLTELWVYMSEIWVPSLFIPNMVSVPMKGFSSYSVPFEFYTPRNPAVVWSSGDVYAFVGFSISVSCKFDFTDYPFDVQRCPMVIMNSKEGRLTEAPLSWWQPEQIKMMSDYFVTEPNESNTTERSYLRPGWRLVNWTTLTMYMYVVNETENGQVKYKIVHSYTKPDPLQLNPSYVRPVLEAWFEFRRALPYFGILTILPSVVTCCLTLLSFWISSEPVAVVLLTVDLFIQAIYVVDLLDTIPLNEGAIPKILKLYAFNFIMTWLAMFLYIVISRFPSSLDKFLFVIVQPARSKLGSINTRFSSATAKLHMNISLNFNENSILEEFGNRPKTGSNNGPKTGQPGSLSIVSTPSMTNGAAIAQSSSALSMEATITKGENIKAVEEMQWFARRFLFLVFLLAYIFAIIALIIA